MPEQNFEQQARNMVNGFEKEPKPEIWQNVRKAIQQPRRKRRIVLWWWLLPLCLIGSGITLYTVSNKTAIKEAQVAKPGPLQPKAAEQTILAHQPTQQVNAKPAPQKEHTENNSLSKNKSVNQKHITVTNKLNTTSPTPKMNNGASVENTVKATPDQQGVIDAGNELKTNNNPAINATPNNDEITNDKGLHVENRSSSVTKDSIQKGDRTQDAALANTLSPSDSSQHIATNKKVKTTKLQWGIIVEGGVAARKSSPLSFTGFEKSLDYQSSNDPVTVPSNGQSRSNTYFSNNIKHGAAFGVGVALQKRVNKSVDFFADAAYHYQSFHIETSVYKDSLVLNNSFTTYTGFFKAHQSFHFASLFAGINWHFINSKPVQFGVSAGLDNLFLLATNQKLSSVSGSSFSLSNAMYRSDSAFAPGNFYKYQPSLYAGVLINIKLRNQQVQLVPFARSSIRQLDKNAISNNNHLFSGGLRAVYFFK